MYLKRIQESKNATLNEIENKYSVPIVMSKSFTWLALSIIFILIGLVVVNDLVKIMNFFNLFKIIKNRNNQSTQIQSTDDEDSSERRRELFIKLRQAEQALSIKLKELKNIK